MADLVYGFRPITVLNELMTHGVKRILLASGAIALVAAAAHVAGIRINTTRSYPSGLYIKTSAPIERGALVIFCPPDTAPFQEARTRGYIGKGFCPGGYEYMIKKAVAFAGDRVAITMQGVTINGELLPNSKPLPNDAAGRGLHRFSLAARALDANEVLLMSDYSAKSFDGRYFGTLHTSAIISAIQPLWVFEE